MNSQEIRKRFISFFKKHGHTYVPSSSLIPAQDPTLLFSNAGMNQFKDVFLGTEKRSYKRAVSIQKCIRAGGKHNDLDMVGFTKRHLTFFEMLGNFSFGDYFKKEAISFAWDFITKDLALPVDTLWVSVYEKDKESHDIWKTYISNDRIVRLGAADNFWQMGETGPCGPCTELYIDTGEGCGSKTCAPGCSCDRFLEVWNLVFMEFNRQEDGSLISLKHTGVDTGMGLERLAMIMQDKDSIFETDLFWPIIQRAEQLSGKRYKDHKNAFHVLADHIRSASFAIADGCMPSNDGRGYVIRKIIRRASLFSLKISEKNFFPELLEPLIDSMGENYPELIRERDTIKRILMQETERFSQNLRSGKQLFEKYSKTLSGKKLDGAYVFMLYDTYGFPPELTKVMADEKGLAIDWEGFEVELEKQRSRSGKKQKDHIPDLSVSTAFTGYDEIETSAIITALVCDGTVVNTVPLGEQCWVVTDRTPFFIECGGQVSDVGSMIFADRSVPIRGLKKFGNALGALVTAPQELSLGMKIVCKVDKHHRLDTMNNHTATHLVQAALQELLGKEVNQSGSLVHPTYLRFDFTYQGSISPEQISQVERRVNEKIRENLPVVISYTTYDEAIKRGVMAIFGEKYNPENVRVVEVPGFSAELCGGTHVTRTGDIGCFKITEVSSLSAGNKRLVAVTGSAACALFQEYAAIIKTIGNELKVKPQEIVDVFYKQREQIKELQKTLKEFKKSLWDAQKTTWLNELQEIRGMPFAYIKVPRATMEDLRYIADILLKHRPGIYVVTSPAPEKTLCLIVSEKSCDLTLSLPCLRQLGFTGGGTSQALQGSFIYLDSSMIEHFKQWVYDTRG